MYWQSSLDETIERTNQLAQISTLGRSDLKAWLSHYSEGAPTSSNAGSSGVPFQRWFHFKEAFSPKFVADTISAAPYDIKTCIDPFGGSGTTALTTRFLGIDSISIELNPFVADLAKAKVTPVSPSKLMTEATRIVDDICSGWGSDKAAPNVPATFREPGLRGRWLFSAETFDTCVALNRRIACTKDRRVARLLRVLLGSVLVRCSNVVINGKGRRYRKNWQDKERTPTDLILAFEEMVAIAVADLSRFSPLSDVSTKVYVGDARRILQRVNRADIAIFSPPYPNSFDYTDVYNIELWMLGYFSCSADNSLLRKNTLRSHVQIKWPPVSKLVDSRSLRHVLAQLNEVRQELWNTHIPEMIAHYFSDLRRIFVCLHRVLPKNGRAVIAIGDSQYAGVHVNVGGILEEVVRPVEFKLIEKGSIRSMRNSAQHGGTFELAEHCLVFEKT